MPIFQGFTFPHLTLQMSHNIDLIDFVANEHLSQMMGFRPIKLVLLSLIALFNITFPSSVLLIPPL